MIDYNESSTELSSEDEKFNSYNNSNETKGKICLNPIFFEPSKFITADFQIEVRNLCPGSRIALIAEVHRNLPGGYYKTLATVHDIFDVPNCISKNGPCTCKTILRYFRDVILDLNLMDDSYHNLTANDLSVVVVSSNYISRNDSYCSFYD